MRHAKQMEELLTKKERITKTQVEQCENYQTQKKQMFANHKNQGKQNARAQQGTTWVAMRVS